MSNMCKDRNCGDKVLLPMIHHLCKKLDYGEMQYINLLRNVIDHGVHQSSRSGNILALFGGHMKFDALHPPLFQSRKINYKFSFEEFWFFLNGRTQTRELEDKGINFWRGNTSREFLDKKGLYNLEEGDMGKAYGYQLRYYNDMIDQIQNTVQLLTDDPTSRRIYTTMWNPSQEHEMALPPCWHSHQFVVVGNTLNLKVINRSLDILYGAPFAVSQYWMYLLAMARLTGFEVGEMICDLSHIHVYENQIEYATEYLNFVDDNLTDLKFRIEENPPSIKISDNIVISGLDDLLSLSWDDFVINNLDQMSFRSVARKPLMSV